MFACLCVLIIPAAAFDIEPAVPVLPSWVSHMYVFACVLLPFVYVCALSELIGGQHKNYYLELLFLLTIIYN